MKNPELSCPDFWEGEPCVDGDRCPTHSECEYHCGEHGYIYKVPGNLLASAHEDGDWDKYIVPCECLFGAQYVGRIVGAATVAWASIVESCNELDCEAGVGDGMSDEEVFELLEVGSDRTTGRLEGAAFAFGIMGMAFALHEEYANRCDTCGQRFRHAYQKAGYSNKRWCSLACSHFQ